MPAFSHCETTPIRTEHVGGIWGRHREACPYCGTQLRSGHFDLAIEIPDSGVHSDNGELYICRACGWWIERRDVEGCFGPSHPDTGLNGAQREFSDWHRRGYGITGALKNLDLTDLGTPVNEIRSYLMARWNSRFEVHPRKFEEVVQSVMRSLGYEARVTAYSGDGGIDVVLDGPNDTIVGIQVKRWSRSISVEQIRSFVGALCLNGYRKGVFITTSRYQRGAFKLVNVAKDRSIFVELLDSTRFLEVMRVAQIADFNDYTSEICDHLKTVDFSQYSLLWIDSGGCSHNPVTWSLVPTDDCGREIQKRSVS